MIRAVQVALLVCALARQGTALLPYVKPCPRSLPDVNQCFLDSVKSAFPYFVAGDPEHRIPSLDPFKMEVFKTEQKVGDNTMRFVFRNIVAHGAKDMVILDTRIDFDEQTIFISTFTPVLDGSVDFEVQGPLIATSGHLTAISRDIFYNVTVDYELETKPGSELQYFKIKAMHSEHKLGRTKVRVENLLGGNKALEANLNRFLNENLPVLEEMFKPYREDGAKHFTELIFSKFQEFVSFTEMFPEN